MLTANVLRILKRHKELSEKVGAGTITDDEKVELDKVGKAVEALTDPSKVDVGKTKLTTMTLEEFKTHVSNEQASAEKDLDPARLALLKRNIDSVKAQGKSDPKDVVAVELAVGQSTDDRFADLGAKFDALADKVIGALKGFDGRTSTGVEGEGEGEGEGSAAAGEGDGDDSNTQTGKQEKPAAEALAREAIDSLITRFKALKDKLTAGTLKLEDIQMAWAGEWELRNIIEGAAAILAKSGELSELVTELLPALKKLDKDSGDGDGDDAGNEDGKDGEGDGEPPVKKFSIGTDLAPPIDDGAFFKAAKNK